jgi:hypothetical protein
MFKTILMTKHWVSHLPISATTTKKGYGSIHIYDWHELEDAKTGIRKH